MGAFRRAETFDLHPVARKSVLVRSQTAHRNNDMLETGRIQAVDDIYEPVLQPSLAEAVHYVHYAGQHDLLLNSFGLHPALSPLHVDINASSRGLKSASRAFSGNICRILDSCWLGSSTHVIEQFKFQLGSVGPAQSPKRSLLKLGEGSFGSTPDDFCIRRIFKQLQQAVEGAIPPVFHCYLPPSFGTFATREIAIA
jgi:hypothetical protein